MNCKNPSRYLFVSDFNQRISIYYTDANANQRSKRFLE